MQRDLCVWPPASRWLLAAVCLCSGATAGTGGQVPPEADDEEPPRFEGAVGLVLNAAPHYAGSAGHGLRATPSIYLRYGRWSISTSGVFVSRRADDVFRGLGSDLHRSDTLRTHFGLRLERGRDSARSEQLGGPGSRSTVRGRFTAVWMPQGLHRTGAWKLTAAAGVDLLGRGGGQVADLSVGREHAFGPALRWHYGLNLSAASSRYMRTRYEVTPADAARAGLPAYTPGAGLRELSLGTGWRWYLDPQWQLQWGAAVGQLLGPAARSPLTQRATSWSLQAGAARSF